MCLDTIHSKKERDELLKDLPDEFTVWKVVLRDVCNSRYVTNCMSMPLHAGEVAFKQNIIERFLRDTYRGGGHFWLEKNGAKYWKTFMRGQKIVRCRVRKEWVVNVGRQGGFTPSEYNVLVVKKAIFPKYIGESNGK